MWSVQIPNPLTLGGNGDIGEIDILNPDGTKAIVIGAGQTIVVYDGVTPIIEIGVFSPDGNAARPVISVQADAPANASKIFMDVNAQGIPAISFTIGSNGFASAGFIRARTWNGANNDNVLEASMSTKGGVNNGIVAIREIAAGGDTEIVINKPLVPVDRNTAVGADFATETWHNLTLANLWVVDTLTPQYRLMPDGTVMLQGLIKNGTIAAGTVIGTLPAGYRPLQQQRFITAEQQLGTGFRHMAVQTNGDIKIFNATAAFAALDGIHFPII